MRGVALRPPGRLPAPVNGGPQHPGQQRLVEAGDGGGVIAAQGLHLVLELLGAVAEQQEAAVAAPLDVQVRLGGDLDQLSGGSAISTGRSG
jgi:hypothetical protein